MTLLVRFIPSDELGSGLPRSESARREALEVETDYVSFVNSGTFGPPPLVAPSKDGNSPKAQPGDTVLYINTSVVPAFEIERLTDS